MQRRDQRGRGSAERNCMRVCVRVTATESFGPRGGISLSALRAGRVEVVQQHCRTQLKTPSSLQLPESSTLLSRHIRSQKSTSGGVIIRITCSGPSKLLPPAGDTADRRAPVCFVSSEQRDYFFFAIFFFLICTNTSQIRSSPSVDGDRS